MGNQKPEVEEETIQWLKRQTTIYTTLQIKLKIEQDESTPEFMCPGRVGSFCSSRLSPIVLLNYTDHHLVFLSHISIFINTY